MLHPPEPVGPRFYFETDLATPFNEMLFDIPRHKAPLLGLSICVLETREIDIRTRKRDARCLLVFAEPTGIYRGYLIQVIVEPPGIECGFPKHFWQVDIVERQNLADHIKHPIVQHGSHLVELREKPLQYPSLNNWLAVFRFTSDEVENVDVALLPDAMDAAEPLL